LIVVLSLGVQLPFSLLLAVLVGRDLPGRTIYRTLFFMPYVLSEVITAIMWLFLYHPDPDRGFINALLVLLPGGKAIPWMGETDIVLLFILWCSPEIFWVSHAVVFDRVAEYPC
jgi:raffinose/stachyose/melibiose transport system permease protein